MFTELGLQAAKPKASRFKRFAQMNAFYRIQKFFDKSKAPQGMDFTKFIQTLDGCLTRKPGAARKTDLHQQDPPGGGHAFYGQLQLRHRAGGALRDPLRHSGGTDNPVLLL